MKRLNNLGACFPKPLIDSCSDNGYMLLNIKNGKDIKGNKNIDEIIERLGNSFVTQQKIMRI